jgi:4-hydroxybenzoate polyprenyltransferase
VSKTDKGKIKAFVKLTRLDYSFFSALGVCLSGILAGDLIGLQLEYLTAFFVVLFSAMGSFALNDYYDFKIDIKNRRYDRPLVLRLLSRKEAMLIGVALYLITFLLLLFLNFLAVLIVLASLFLFFFYNFGLKRKTLAKNILIAYAYVATIFFGSLISDSTLEPLIIYFAIMGFIVGLAYEIMLDLSDVKGDKQFGIVTLPTKLGVDTAAKLPAILYGVIIVLDPLPFFVSIDLRLYMDYTFFLLILTPVLSYFSVIRSLTKTLSKEILSKLKKRIFFTMQIGCIAYLAGVLL